MRITLTYHVCISAAPKKIMQQFLEKGFPMETDLSDREMDLLAFQVHVKSHHDLPKCPSGLYMRGLEDAPLIL